MENKWIPVSQTDAVVAYYHPDFGYVSIDLDLRIADVGMVKPARFNSIVTSSKYRGRGWKDRLVSDATREAERLWAS